MQRIFGAGSSDNRIKQALIDLWLLARPLMWIVTLVPFAVGQLMARRQPGADHGSAILPVLAGVVVWGPLLCLAALAVNDAYDVEGDSVNPRRIGAPVANGRVSARSAFIVAHAAGAVAVVVAGFVAMEFALVVFAFLALGWLYSVPPVRLKVRPGFDVAINAVGNGGLSMLAGWTAVRQVDDFPWAIFVLGCLVGAALYLPTTMADYESDVAAGYSTVAVQLGQRAACRIGLGFWTAAGVGCLLLAANGIVLPRQAVWVLAVSVPTLIWVYHWAFSRVHGQRELLRGMGIVGFGSLLPLALIVLMYVKAV